MDFQPQKKFNAQDKFRLEPAPVMLRMIAFFLDMVLLGAIAGLLLGKWFLPAYYPAEYGNFMSQLRDCWYSSSTGSFSALTDEKLRPLFVFFKVFLLILWWGYFSLSDIFLTGSTLGKRIFSLQVIQSDVNELPSAYTSVLRGLFKSIFVWAYVPLLIIDALCMFFNPERRAGHDWLCRTRVVIGGILVDNKKTQVAHAEEDNFF